MILTGIAMLLGIAFCIPPISVYVRQKPVKLFGLILFTSGFLLITSFKWTEVAIKIRDYEVKIANAEKALQNLSQVNATYLTALSQANSKLSTTNQTLSTALNNSEQFEDDWAETVASEIHSKVIASQMAGHQMSANDLIPFIKQALDEKGLAVVSNEAVTKTMHDIDVWQQDWLQTTTKFENYSPNEPFEIAD
ncbi:hypothetical protein MACH01_34440 [Thalassospira tepidiphila]|nr:hypothetical protein MACH01_34440 [Thalassospira tepidiphila]